MTVTSLTTTPVSIEQDPNKEVSRFILLKKSDLHPTSEKCKFIDSLQTHLLNHPNLSNYHFAKIICNFPELLDEREDQLDKRTKEFLEQVSSDYQNEKLLTRAAKLSYLILQNPLLKKCVTTPLIEKKMISSKGTLLETATYEWCAQIPFSRPLLLGNFSQNGSSEISESLFKLVDRFLKGHPLPRLNPDELIKLIEQVRPLGYQELMNACYFSLDYKIDENNVVDILNHALIDQNKKTIEHCLYFLNSTLSKGVLKWCLIRGLEMVIEDVNPDILTILKSFFSNISNIEFTTIEAIEKLIQENICLPVESLEIKQTDIFPSTLNQLLGLFPKINKCTLTVTSYIQCNPNNAPLLSKIKILGIISRNKEEHLLTQRFKIWFKHQIMLYCCPILPRIFKLKEMIFIRFFCSSEGVLDLGQLSQENKDLITDEILEKILQATPNLRKISLAGCSKLTDVTAKFIAKNFPNLQCLDLSDCNQMTDEAAFAISSLLQLEVLILNGCQCLTNKGGIAISKRLRALQWLSLGRCIQISDETGHRIALMKNLKTLEISHCQKITDSSIFRITTELNLIVLNISGCKNLTSAAFKAISQFPNLQRLFLEELETLSNRNVREVCLNLGKTLKMLSVWNCPRLTDEIGNFIVCLPLLTHLNIGKCKFTDKLIPFLGNLHLLEFLDLKKCRNMTAEGKILLKKYLPERAKALFDEKKILPCFPQIR